MIPNSAPPDKKKRFTKDQKSFDTERDMLGKPQRDGASTMTPDDSVGASKLPGDDAPVAKAPSATAQEGQLPKSPAATMQEMENSPEPGDMGDMQGAPVPPTIESVAAKQDEICQQLNAITQHLGIKNGDQPKPPELADTDNDSDDYDDLGFGGGAMAR